MIFPSLSILRLLWSSTLQSKPVSPYFINNISPVPKIPSNDWFGALDDTEIEMLVMEVWPSYSPCDDTSSWGKVWSSQWARRHVLVVLWGAIGSRLWMCKCARDGVNRRYTPSLGTSPCHFSVFSHPTLYFYLTSTSSSPSLTTVLCLLAGRSYVVWAPSWSFQLSVWDPGTRWGRGDSCSARPMKIRRLGAKSELLAWPWDPRTRCRRCRGWGEAKLTGKSRNIWSNLPHATTNLCQILLQAVETSKARPAPL